MRAPPRQLRLAVIALTGLTLVGAAPRQSNDAYNRNVRVHNQTGWPMTHLQASSGGGWTGDLLASGPLSPGASAVVRIDDGAGGCRYSLRAQFDNGQTLQRDGVNACQVADYYFTR
ncbi:hypothetical protein [Brevundimonas sp. NIBR11]|uniref:hypothetical protein n=1 Tax=Brevundimonas sp. NIBR11 TaxID=3015999 RepID=UPI0022F14387|nr:hypothetical protein [Brevundimonas sp. NIBR11]WGM32607.1 hypothetical protein KKHFBJBL_02861 [Brevundimonas sp. NIBR11]